MFLVIFITLVCGVFGMLSLIVSMHCLLEGDFGFFVIAVLFGCMLLSVGLTKLISADEQQTSRRCATSSSSQQSLHEAGRCLPELP